MTQPERDALVKEFIETAGETFRILSADAPRLDALGATDELNAAKGALAAASFARGDEILDALGVEASPLATILAPSA